MSPIRRPAHGRLVRALCCAAFLPVFLQGCSIFDGKVTEHELERQLAEDLTGWFDGRPRVDCAGDPGGDRETPCSVITLQGDTWSVAATGVSAGGGRIVYEIRQLGVTSEIPRIEPYDLDDQIAATLAAELGSEPVVNCNDPLKGVIGASAACNADHYTGEQWTVHAEVTGVQGTDIEYKLRRTPR
jgi:hypothetical protein